MFFPSRARLASWRPVTQRRRNLENSAVPTLLARATHVLPSCYYARAEGDLEACWNRILAVFDPHAFSHSQGQGLTNHHPCRQSLLATALPPQDEIAAAIARCAGVGCVRRRWFQDGDAITRLKVPSTSARVDQFGLISVGAAINRFRPLALCRRRLSARGAGVVMAGVRKPSQQRTSPRTRRRMALCANF